MARLFPGERLTFPRDPHDATARNRVPQLRLASSAISIAPPSFLPFPDTPPAIFPTDEAHPNPLEGALTDSQPASLRAGTSLECTLSSHLQILAALTYLRNARYEQSLG